ncbi:hypothetical protein QQY24_18430 [Streptomyces sp. TG1A-8]|uniref:hypothetical protein n=1 Tax=Streptomyces sp. TG1A-8 TaxID=3051385 RepID=UPI00265BE907|nr:hypothetical protein [Streptomyces sp. TG1A-8]MDO0927294.1 hypothetical protein [Streptomyces sp. TG1A-8]
MTNHQLLVTVLVLLIWGACGMAAMQVLSKGEGFAGLKARMCDEHPVIRAVQQGSPGAFAVIFLMNYGLGVLTWPAILISEYRDHRKKKTETDAR